MEDTENKGPQENVSSQDQQNGDTTLVACRAELLEMKNRYLYLTAEFDNYKKRSSKEQASLIEMAQDRVIIDFLSIVDDLGRAFEELKLQQLPQDVATHFQGISMIVKNLDALLKKYEIEEISHKGTFDPQFFEAVMQQESPDHASGEILAILQKGYMRKGRVLRPAKVAVAL